MQQAKEQFTIFGEDMGDKDIVGKTLRGIKLLNKWTLFAAILFFTDPDVFLLYWP